MPFRVDMWVTIGTAAPVVAAATAISLGVASGRMRDALPGIQSFVDSELASLDADLATYGRALKQVRTDAEVLEARAVAIPRRTHDDHERTTAGCSGYRVRSGEVADSGSAWSECGSRGYET